jgi:hypothetical protein
MHRARAAQPEMFPFARFAAVSIELALKIIRKALRDEQFAFVKRPERNATARIGAFLQHQISSASSIIVNWPEEMHRHCRQIANPAVHFGNAVYKPAQAVTCRNPAINLAQFRNH